MAYWDYGAKGQGAVYDVKQAVSRKCDTEIAARFPPIPPVKCHTLNHHDERGDTDTDDKELRARAQRHVHFVP